jgi:hypothetical protein
MSKAHTHRRRWIASPRRLGRGLRRRLGFEVMEWRCLLSAATLQFNALSLPGTLDTTQLSLTAVIGGQQAASSSIAQGGFIDLGGLQSQSMNDHVPPVTAGAGGVGIGVSFGGAVTDILGDNLYQLPRGDSTTNLLTNLETAGGGFSVRPIVISPSFGSPSAVQRVFDPGRSLTLNQDRGGQEGGEVPIEKILKGDERFDSERFAASILVDDTPAPFTAPDDSPAIAARSLALPAESDTAAEPPLASAAPTELALSLDQAASALIPAKSSVITGELARAMVFEMAGGEPAWIRPAVTSDKIKAVVPTDGQDVPRADVTSLSPAAAQQAALRASGSRIRLTGNQVEFPLPTDVWTGWNSIASSPDAVRHAGVERGTIRGGFAASNVPDSAVVEVFGQIGRSERTPVRGSFEEDSGSGPMVAGSVIALLMLERAAARYKSRSERQVLTVVAGPPRI